MGNSGALMGLREQLLYLRDLARSKSVRAFSIVMAANFAVTAIGFLSSILLFRSQSAELISTIFPLVGLLLFLDQVSDMGLSVAYIRFASADFEESREKFLRTTNTAFLAHTLLVTAFVAAAILGAAPISGWLFQTEAHAKWVAYTAAWAWLYSLGNFLQCVLQAQKRFHWIAWGRLLPNVVKAGLLLALVLLRVHDFAYFFAAFLATPALTILILAPALELRWFLPRRPAPGEFRRLLDFSKWIFVSGVAVACISQLDLFMLRSMASESEVVRFLGGQRLASVLPLLIGTMVTVLLPKVSSYRTKAELRFFVRKALLLSPFLFLFILSFSLTAPWVIPRALGAKYDASVPIFQAYCWVYSIDSVITLSSLFVYGLRLVHWFSLLNLVQLGLNFALNLLLIPKYGAMGVCVSAGLIRLLAVPLMLFLGWRESVLTED
jgi:O-antigen/teichoic acid export membrane protein